MHEIFDQIHLYVRAIWRRRWQVLIIAALISAAGCGFVSAMPDTFTAKARVFIDADSMLRRILSDVTVQTDVNAKVQMVTREILSRPNLEKVAVETDLYLRARNDVAFEGLISRLAKDIQLSGTARTQEYSISYDDHDPQMAKRVVQSLLTQLVESSLSVKRTDTDVAQSFLDQQILDHERRLREAEERLEKFKRDNFGLLPGEGKGYYSRLGEVRANLTAQELKLKQLLEQRAELQRHIVGEEPTFGFGSSSQMAAAPKNMTTPYDSRIDNLEARLDELLLIYTDSHPDVVSVRSTIAELKRQRDEEIASRPAVRASHPAQAVEQNPVYQQMKISLASVESEIASQQVLVDEYRRRAQELDEKVDAIPRVERELADLNRDYATVQQQFERLLMKKESAHLSEQAEASSEDLKFRILEPAFVPSLPSGPNRILFHVLVFILALAAAVALAVLRYLIRPTFDNRTQLRDGTGLPVLGAVSMVFTSREKLAHRIGYLWFVAVMATYLAVFAAVLLLETRGINLAAMLARAGA